MPETTRREIQTSAPERGTLATLWLALGIVFSGGALYFLQGFLSAVRAAAPDSSLRRGAWMGISFLALFLAFGLAWLTAGVVGLAGKGRRARAAAAHPNEPWFRDFDWNPEGVRKRRLSGDMGSFAAVPLVSAVAFFFNRWALGKGAGELPLVAVAVIDFVLLAFLLLAFRQVVRKLFFGGAFIRYDRFPFFLGERMEVHIGSEKPIPAGSPITATLRYVEEEIQAPAGGGAPHHAYYELYADKRVVESPGPSLKQGTAVSFTLPAGEYATALSASRRRFWQLQLSASSRGGDLDETFLIPAYPKP